MDVIGAILFILPAYVANAVPVLFGGGTPIDFNRKFYDGRRIFGNGKTWRGFVAGITFGTLIGMIEGDIFNSLVFGKIGFLLSFGAMSGDLAGSFIKRRIGMEEGKPFFLIDQLFFLIFALIFASPIRILKLEETIFLIFLTYFLHVLSNFIANKMGLKTVPW